MSFGFNFSLFFFFIIMCVSFFYFFLLVGRLQEKTLKQLAIKSHTYNTHRKPFKSRSFCTEPLKMVKSLHDWSLVFYYFFANPVTIIIWILMKSPFLIAKQPPHQRPPPQHDQPAGSYAHFSLSDQNIYGGMDIVVDFHVQFFVANNYIYRRNIVIFCNRHTLMNL